MTVEFRPAGREPFGEVSHPARADRVDAVIDRRREPLLDGSISAPTTRAPTTRASSLGPTA